MKSARYVVTNLGGYGVHAEKVSDRSIKVIGTTEKHQAIPPEATRLLIRNGFNWVPGTNRWER